MEKELTIFLIIGLIQLSAFKGAHNVSRSPPTHQPAWALNAKGQTIIYLLFTITGLCYVFTLIYGFINLEWWIPLVCLVLGFPFAYYLLIRPITGDILPMTIGSVLSVLGTGFIATYWFL